MSSHPDFERYRALYQDEKYGEALQTVDRLFAEFPQSVSLHWHRTLCLEKLERYEDALTALDRFLERKADYAPAILKRIEYAGLWLDLKAPYPGYPDEEGLDAITKAERRRASELRERLAREQDAQHEGDLRRILSAEPQNAEALFLLAQLLRFRTINGGDQPDADARAESHDLLERAIQLAPENLRYRRARAERRRNEAVVITAEEDANASAGHAATDPNLVRTFGGPCYRRDLLEQSAQDYEFCWRQGGEVSDALRWGSVLHDFGRYDDALKVHDQALAALAPDDPRREWVLERRKRSENQGGGEREELAQLLLSGLDENPDKDRTLAEDNAAQAILGVADAIRRGSSVSEALTANISDDPDTMVAMSLARQVLNVAYEPAPQLEAVDPKGYPKYQRQHCDAAEAAALRLGLKKLADAEARGLFAMLGSHVLLRILVNDGGDIGLASYAMKPKWPGLIGFLLLLVQGKWKVQRMVECNSAFDDGSAISTQPESVSPFEAGGKIRQIKLPKNATIEQIFRAHTQALAEFRAANPAARPIVSRDLAGVEARWVAGQKAKAEYRKSIGYVSDRELKAMLGGHYDRLAEKVKAQLRLMAAE